MENIDVTTFDAVEGRIGRHDLAGPDSQISQRLRAARSQRHRSGQAAAQRSSRRRPAVDHQRSRQERPGSAAADAAAQGAAQGICHDRDRRALHAADSQAVRRLQSRLRADARSAEKTGHPAGQNRSPVPQAQAGRNRKAVQGMRRHRLQGPDRDLRAAGGRRQNARGVAQETAARPGCAKRPGPPACGRSKRKACCSWPKASRRWPNCNEC